MPQLTCCNQRGIQLNEQCPVPVHYVEHHVLGAYRSLESDRRAAIRGDGKVAGKRLAEGDASGIVDVDDAVELAGAVRGELRDGIQFAVRGHAGEVEAVGPGERAGVKRRRLLQGGAGGDETYVSLYRQYAGGR